VFPVILDVNHPEFYQRLDICIENNEKLSAIANSNAPSFVKFFQKLPLFASNAWQLLRLYFIKPIDMTPVAGTVL
jgi:magnesium-protoporphyrin IX monomethyl ester (oxidative) cyclase